MELWGTGHRLQHSAYISELPIMLHCVPGPGDDMHTAAERERHGRTIGTSSARAIPCLIPSYLSLETNGT